VYHDLELFRFVAESLQAGRSLMLLVVAESSGSSPGRRGYKMAVASDGELIGSIGGGLMEVNLVNRSREILSGLEDAGEHPPAVAGSNPGSNPAHPASSFLVPQVHQRNSPNASGMICSGRQTVIFRLLTQDDLPAAQATVHSLSRNRHDVLTIGPGIFAVGRPGGEIDKGFEKVSETEFVYREALGQRDHLYIVGGGHCALALSELASKLDFHIRLFDDRPNLNTVDKNRFAHEISIIDSYEQIADYIPSSPNAYVVVMTLGYNTDQIVIKRLLDRDFKYFGVLGSRSKMATLLKDLKNDGYSSERLDRIHTPIGLPIGSRTPEEIAISIAAEIISVRNGS
jgi:xanthine dehydrogenase accessory factor